MQHDSARCSGLARRAGHLALFVALAVVPVLALNSLATANTTSAARAKGGPRPALSDERRQCLAEQGVTLPDRGGDGGSALTQEQRQALRQAREACGPRGPHEGRARPGVRALTDAQRQCLADQGVTVPPQSVESRAGLRAAAEACGLPAPGHHRGADATI